MKTSSSEFVRKRGIPMESATEISTVAASRDEDARRRGKSGRKLLFSVEN